MNGNQENIGYQLESWMTNFQADNPYETNN